MISLNTLALFIPSVALASSGSYVISDRDLGMVKTTSQGNAVTNYSFVLSSEDFGIAPTTCESHGVTGGCASVASVYNVPCDNNPQYTFSFFIPSNSPNYTFEISGPAGTGQQSYPFSYNVPNRGAAIGDRCVGLAAPIDSTADVE